MSALRELIAFFGVQVDDKPLDKVGEKIEGLTSLVEKAGATIGIAFGVHEIAEFVRSQIEAAVEIGHTSEMLGLGVEDLQAFQYAAANAGLSADAATTSLRFLNKNLGEAAEGNATAAAAFQKLGVSIKDADGKVRPTQDVFAEVAEGISKLPSPAQKTAKAMELFGRAGARLIPLLDKGGDGIEALYKEFEALGGGITEDYIKVAEEAHHETLKLDVVWRGVKATIGAQLIPAFGWMVSKIGELVGWFREFSRHSYIVQTALATLGAIVAGIVVVWGFLNFEILLVVAAIALLILIVDDVYTAFKGGKSVIGDFIDSIWGVGTTETVFVDLQNWAYKAWGVIEQISVGIGQAINGAVALASEIGHAAHLISDDEYKLVQQQVLEKSGELDDKMKQADIDASSNHIRRALSIVVDHPGQPPKNLVTGGAPPTASAPAGAAAGPVSVTNQTKIDVDVKTTGSPAEAGKAVAAGVRDGMNDSDLAASYAALSGGGGF